MKKKISLCLLTVILCFTLVGCGKTENKYNNDSANNESRDKYQKAYICALNVAKKFNIKKCSILKEVAEGFYNYECSNIIIRIINSNFDIYSTTMGYSSVSGYCDSNNNPVISVKNTSPIGEDNNTSSSNSTTDNGNASNNSSSEINNSSNQGSQKIEEKEEEFKSGYSLKDDDVFSSDSISFIISTKSGNCSGCTFDAYLNDDLIKGNISYSSRNQFRINNLNIGDNVIKYYVKKDGNVVDSGNANYYLDASKAPTPTLYINNTSKNTTQDSITIIIHPNENGCKNCNLQNYLNDVNYGTQTDYKVNLSIGENNFKFEIKNKYGKSMCKNVRITRYDTDNAPEDLGNWIIEGC